MSERFFVDRPFENDRVTLAGSEAHHLIHVMRARLGTQVHLFDGSGDEFLASVEAIERSHVVLAVVQRRHVDRELTTPLTLAVALPKGDRSRWLVEKAVELGVTCLVPLETARTVTRASAGLVRRLERTVIEASKQCGRNRLMDITATQRWSDFLVAGPSDARSDGGYLAHPDASPRGQVDRRPAAPGARRRPPIRSGNGLCVAVGPEGGWVPEEIECARKVGWTLVDLGPRILRTETAAVALVARLVTRLDR